MLPPSVKGFKRRRTKGEFDALVVADRAMLAAHKESLSGSGRKDRGIALDAVNSMERG
jgi:hypothetical protein